MTPDASGNVAALFAVASPGLEQIVAAELAALGFDARAEPGGAAWSGPVADVHRANLHLRTASRVLLRMDSFRARTFFELERHAARVDWRRFVSPDGTAGFRVTSRKSKLYHERAIAERLMDAISNAVPGVQFTDAATDDDESANTAQLFVVRVMRDVFTISADTSGALLHRRGYRQAVGKAPLRENIAAAMLLATEWDGGEPLADPLCGSGVIPIEAALIARRIAPGIANAARAPREYAFHNWPEFDATTWEEEVQRARDNVLPGCHVPIVAADRDAGAVRATQENAARAGVAENIEVQKSALTAFEPPAAQGLILTNPPYGVRVGERAPLRDLYAAFGRVAREQWAEWRIGWLSADPHFDAQMKLPAREILKTKNGGIDIRLMMTPGGSPPPA